MKVCHVTSVHPRHDLRIFEKECVSLSNGNYDVFLIVNDDLPDEELNGVHIISTGFRPQNRKERLLYSADRILKKALSVDAEIYHLHDPELLRIISRLKNAGKIVIFDAHEDTEEQIKDKNWIPKILRFPIAKIYAFYAHRMMCKADGLITVTPNIVNKLEKYNANIEMITNYPIVTARVEQSMLKKKEKFVFFAGGISEQWCHEIIAEAARWIDNMKYIFAGRSYDDHYVQKICALGGDSVEYLGVVDHEDVMSYYREACAGMAILKCSQVGDEGTLGNTKLFEIMQAGIPVICSDLRLWREIIEENQCGICVNSESVDSIINAVTYILSHPREAKIMGHNGRRAVMEKYNWKTQEKILIDFYKKLVDK